MSASGQGRCAPPAAGRARRQSAVRRNGREARAGAPGEMQARAARDKGAGVRLEWRSERPAAAAPAPHLHAALRDGAAGQRLRLRADLVDDHDLCGEAGRGCEGGRLGFEEGGRLAAAGGSGGSSSREAAMASAVAASPPPYATTRRLDKLTSAAGAERRHAGGEGRRRRCKPGGQCQAVEPPTVRLQAGGGGERRQRGGGGGRPSGEPRSMRYAHNTAQQRAVGTKKNKKPPLTACGSARRKRGEGMVRGGRERVRLEGSREGIDRSHQAARARCRQAPPLRPGTGSPPRLRS